MKNYLKDIGKTLIVSLVLLVTSSLLSYITELLVIQFFPDFKTLVRGNNPIGVIIGRMFYQLPLIWVYLIAVILYRIYLASHFFKKFFYAFLVIVCSVFLLLEIGENLQVVITLSYFTALTIILTIARKFNLPLVFYTISLILFFPYWFFEMFSIPLLLIYGIMLMPLSFIAEKLMLQLYDGVSFPES